MEEAASHPRKVKSIGFKANKYIILFPDFSFVFYKVFCVSWKAISRGFPDKLESLILLVFS